MNKIEEITSKATGETKELLQKLVKITADQMREINMLRQHTEQLKHDSKLLRQKLYGQSCEQLRLEHQKDLQILNDAEFAFENPEFTPEGEPEEIATTNLSPRKTKKSLPKYLPREDVVHDLEDSEKVCQQGHELSNTKDIVIEKLDYAPPKIKVIRHIKKQYICKECSKINKKDPSQLVTIKTATMPKSLIPKGIATSGLLAAIAVHKFCDHAPLYRQEQILKRSGIDISRKTMSRWILAIGEAIVPLTNLLSDEIRNYDIAYADETTIQVLNEPNKKSQAKSYVWCFIGGPPDRQSIIYEYHPTRKAQIPETFFEGFKGAIHCDGYQGYNNLLNSPDIIGLNCLAHSRRKFFEACGGKPYGIAAEVLKLIAKAYHIESQLKKENATVEQIFKIRLQKSKPILDKIYDKLISNKNSVAPKSGIGKAIKYTLDRWQYLINYLKDGRFEIDNNRSERQIKPFVIGRKNWMFAVSQHGANSSTRLFSLIETAKANKLNVFEYLRYVFDHLPSCQTVTDYEKLLPFNLSPEQISC